ncbi:hypothetical protein CLOBOL_01555 [Enterocloster bolteae ATCC BAA-613]|uniref:Uncharacterized protein n=1 Tax=Enterocloster bolteae (strain ATCC BAA-613 / DSM 15670 / CCUG 46953 / JCM 12243 / WAL 16351) TaxID=411902 RepID=A8RLA7_ENTBW|nr:hypothetical protein CLOBOL_01555 [Enterocloster bolteae ATCC BAA-613]
MNIKQSNKQFLNAHVPFRGELWAFLNLLSLLWQTFS